MKNYDYDQNLREEGIIFVNGIERLCGLVHCIPMLYFLHIVAKLLVFFCLKQLFFIKF